MNNENYLNYYMETMTSVMNDAIVRNISLQANSRVVEEIVQNQNKTIEELQNHISILNSDIEGYVSKINELNNNLNSLNTLKTEVDSNKNQLQHLDTFRNELLKSQKENQELKDQIEYLQLTPAKRKKIDENKSNNKIINVQTNELIKDGGSF